ADFAPDGILAFDLLAAWLAASLPGRRLVWLGDLNYESMWHHTLYARREDPRTLAHLPSNWLACRAWRRLYGEVLRPADGVIVAAQSSVASLAALGVAAAYEPYPWPEGEEEVATALPALPTFLFFVTLTGLG